MQTKHILLTGAAGTIGTPFRQHVGDHYRLRLADRITDALHTDAGHEAIAFDIADVDACQRACEGIDTVVHLAADPSPAADFYGSLLDNNIKGTYNIFRAAKDQGCQRVVYASSVQAVENYPLDTQIKPGDPVNPRNMYGVSKCFGEAVASYFARVEGLSSIAVRIGAFDAAQPGDPMSARNLSAYISPRDMSDLLVRCIETPNVQFAIVHAVSDNRFKRLDLTETRRLLGYAPHDDAFALWDIGLPEG